jgi:hypothetical protein
MSDMLNGSLHYDPATDIPPQPDGCWLWANGWAMSRDENDNDVLAGYMGDPVHDEPRSAATLPYATPKQQEALDSDDWNEATFDIPGSDEAREERQYFGEAY